MLFDGSVPMGPKALDGFLRRLGAAFPFVYQKNLARTAGGRSIAALQLGQGDRKILVTAGHHANEYITSMALCAALERYCQALTVGGSFGGCPAGTLYHGTMLYVVPMVCPDGAALVTGELSPEGREFARAKAIAARYPAIPFPVGWKADLSGVDLNLNYPAGWQAAKAIKAALGFAGPAPRDWPGPRPLSQPETMALAGYTCCVHPDLVLALHSQGRVIYHKFGAVLPEGAQELAERFAAATGYALEDVPPQSANGGYKDWFMARFKRPGFTVECGLGENPLPLAQLGQITDEVETILAIAMAR